MSIIDNLKTDISPEETSIVRAKSKADYLKSAVINTYDSMRDVFNNGAHTFWASTDCSPQEIADELGTNASGIFYLHARLGELLYLIDPDSITPGMSVIGQYTNNEDGSIIIASGV